MINSSEYLFLQERGKKKLYVWFSSIDVPANKFEMFKTISSIKDGDIMFLNCKNNSYYIEGVPGLGNFSKSIEALKILIARYDSVMFLGNSMGAYGALLYGILLRVNHIIAYAPELQLGVYGGKYNKENRRVGHHLYNICQLLSVYGIKSSIHIIFGEKAYYDMVGTLSLPKLRNLHLYSIINAYHSLIGIFQQDLFLHIESVEKFEKIKFDGFGTLIDHPEVIAWLYNKSQDASLTKSAIRSDIEFYEANKSRLGYLSGYMAMMIASRCNSAGESQKVVKKYLRESIGHNFHDVECWSTIKRLAPSIFEALCEEYPMSTIKNDRLMTQLAYRNFYEALSN